ncbi:MULTISPECIES: LysR family transcriptional regulator [unclassified Streptomyces]|uniref:LysR family transcriptional regulator n=1 Tax=unclassified Streptomyces TaxID=2593676 RepID=UPI0023667885|nr:MULTISPECIES: LysR family transcriptional regulator [unclassified Streptomyces]MDF3141893.1 LysR family transcriptional regulator [Streptomyces sp. T21Q-yed]WDF39917.1 LysR family transcriptional regulator [Streptomyces sp. T12]
MDWTSSQLRSLVELTRRGTITAVAQALGYTPGGVSQQIAALEKATGMELLRRVGRRVELTDAGRTLALHAERILSTEAEAVEALERSRGEISGVLRVGLFATAAAEILPLALRRVNETHPGLDVHSRDMDVDEVYDAVASGAVDLALGLDYPDVPIPRDPALRVTQLYRERFALAVPTGSMAGVEEISLADTQHLRWILPWADSYYGRAVRTACRRAGVEPDVRHEVIDTAATLALVEAGIGVSTVTDLMLRLRASRFDVVRLRETVERHIVVVFRSSAERRPTVAALLDVLRAVAESRRDTSG